MRETLRQHGSAAVEFGLVIGLLVTVLFGTTELGRAFYQYNTLVKSARAAAREYSLAGPEGTPGSRVQLAKCIAVYGKRPCNEASDVPLMDGLTMSMVVPRSYTKTLPGIPGNLPYTYGCATISGFQFVSLVPWFEMTFGSIMACMRQSPS